MRIIQQTMEACQSVTLNRWIARLMAHLLRLVYALK